MYLVCKKTISIYGSFFFYNLYIFNFYKISKLFENSVRVQIINEIKFISTPLFELKLRSLKKISNLKTSLYVTYCLFNSSS